MNSLAIADLRSKKVLFYPIGAGESWHVILARADDLAIFHCSRDEAKGLYDRVIAEGDYVEIGVDSLPEARCLVQRIMLGI